MTPEAETEINPIAERIKSLARFRHKFLLDQYGFDLTDTPARSPHTEKLFLVTLKKKESNQDEFLARFYINEPDGTHPRMLVRTNWKIGQLNVDQRAVVYGIIGSYCLPESYPSFADGELSSFISDELSTFFRELYMQRSPILERATRILEEFNSKLDSMNASEPN